MNKNVELTGRFKTLPGGIKVHQIRAINDFRTIKRGAIGDMCNL